MVDIDIRIATNGEWFYHGSLIQRHRIVQLFASVLRLEGDQYFLVTPPIKYRIEVNEVPFTAVEMNQLTENDMQKLYFRTNMDEVVLADHAHPLTVISERDTDQLAPYIMVRDGLKAKLTRSVFHQLTALLQSAPSHDDTHNIGVFSAGEFFSFGTVVV